MPNTPFIAQLEASECGAACLAMVLAHHGHHASMTELREACGVSRDGASAGAILRAARAYGLDCAGQRVELDEIGQARLPAILHWQFNHFVVVTRATKRGLHVIDPACGPRFVSQQRADEAFTGVMLTFAPGPTLQRKPPSKVHRRRYARHLADAAPGIALTGLAAFILELLGLAFPVASQVAVDFIVRPKQDRFLFILGGVLAVACLVRLSLAMARARIMAGLRLRLDTRMQVGFIEHLTSLPLSFVTRRGTGDLVSRTEAHRAIRELIRSASDTALDALLLVSYTLLMLAYDLRLGTIVLALTLVRLLTICLVQWRIRDDVASEVAAEARESSVVAETFTNPEAIKAFGLAPHFSRRYVDAMTDRTNATVGRERTEYDAQSVVAFLDAACLALVYWFGGRLVSEGQITLGVLSAFVAMSALIGAPLRSVVHAAAGLPQLKQLARRLEDVWEALPSPQGTLSPHRIQGSVRLSSVSVRHSGDRPLLEDIGLELGVGERIALVGPSGSGKTSLAHVMAGLSEPAAGSVWLDRQPLAQLAEPCLRASVALVSPETRIFDASVHDNITLGSAEYTRSQVVQAAREACIDHDIRLLPDGYETTLARSRLSGGQAQRIGIARALLRSPRVLVLDEATSSLDIELEERILANLSKRECTQVVVTHRASAMRHADRIVVLGDARIVDQGPFDVLYQRCGPFRALVQASGEEAFS